MQNFQEILRPISLSNKPSSRNLKLSPETLPLEMFEM